ncbi:fungal-specific transcription factor domain-containing protein [Cyathus striatus]|nr:fungal-specific transcription factor domain-containing protein [Cyathus striatus]
MSSNDEESNPSSQKKRKIIQRACDNCRRRKIRCDEPVPPHRKCPSCVAHNMKCTYQAEPKKRGRPNGTRTNGSIAGRVDQEVAPSEDKLPKNAVIDVLRKAAALTISSQDDPFTDENLTEKPESPSNTVKSEDNRMWGKSSGMMFMKTAMSFKKKDPEGAQIKRRIMQNRRQIFWEKLPWYKEPISPVVNYTFPPPDLTRKTIDAYFDHVNLFYPLLHRPTFERDVANELHLRDKGFGSVLLLVCAVGSRYMEKIDERAMVDGVHSPLSAGWKWYNQVQVVKSSIANSPTLYDLQVYCLAVHFLTGCCAPHTVWLLAGFGIRLAQDVEGHRGRVPLEKLTKEDELWKRAFWILIAMDRMISMGIGRPCAIFDDHFDLAMPIECDDEYWEHPDPKQRFKQPTDVPSTVTAFNQHLRITKIVAFAMSTVYSIKARFWDYILDEWDQYVVTELDSAMNNWANSLPNHLRWDPNIADDRFFKLSGSLISIYYYVQILIHRPHIREKGHPSPHSFPSLAICTNAARSCALVLDHQMKRCGAVYPYMQLCAVTAVVVLILNIWGDKRSGVDTDPKAKGRVEMCMGVLRKAEDRWYSAGALVDMLNEFTSTEESEEAPGLSGNRTSDAESSADSNATGNENSSPSASSSQPSCPTSDLPPSDSLPPEQDHEIYSIFQNMLETSGPQTRCSDSEQQAAIFANSVMNKQALQPLVTTASL